MTLRVHRPQSVQYFTHFFTTCQVLKVIARVTSTRKMNAFSNETCLNVTFYFSTYCPNLFEHLLIHTGHTVWWRDCCDRWISRWNNTSARSFFINNTFSSTSKLLTPNMYCWSCKTLVTIYWTHLIVNGIWATSFCPEKMNNRTLFLMGCFQR